MTQHLYILTGASRGMGRAMAEQLLAPSNTLLCLSRHPAEALALQATQVGCQLVQWSLDLEHSLEASTQLTTWLALATSNTWASATLINNAGVMPPVVPLSEADPLALAQALRVGLETPLLLTAVFLHATQAWHVPRRVLNISSGLGRRAMASQTGYCAAKAGMDHFTRCLALEEARKPQGAKVCALAPGVIDTDMQVQLRGAQASAFPDRENFVALKNQGQLASPAEAARQILDYLARPDFGSHPVGDLRDAP